jgi:hypothetical protein
MMSDLDLAGRISKLDAFLTAIALVAVYAAASIAGIWFFLA